MSLLTMFMFTEVAGDLPRKTAIPARGHGLLRVLSPTGAAFYGEEINLFILQKGLNLLYYWGLSLNSFPFKCLWGDC